MSSIFCCCRRPQTDSPVKHTPSANQSQETVLDASNVSVAVSAAEIKSEEEIRRATNGNKFEKDRPPSLIETQDQITEFRNGNEDDQARFNNADTLVHPSRIRRSAEPDERAGEAKEGAAEVEENSLFFSPQSVADDILSEDDLASLETYVQRLEAVAEIMENEATSGEGVLGTTPRSSSYADAVGVNSPRVNLSDDKWIVTDYHGDKNLLIHVSDSHQSVIISNCSDSTIQIEGRTESISIENCIKCGVVFHDAVKPLSISDSQRLQIQVLGRVPEIIARNTDGLSIYLSRESQATSVFGYKCSEVNLLIQPADEDDFREVAVPEQFQSHWNGSEWVTSVADVVG